MQDKQLHEATTQWVAVLDVLRSEMPPNEASSLIREVFTVFLLLRWVDVQDTEQQIRTSFGGLPYHSLLPEHLRWRHWVRLPHPSAISERLGELRHYVSGLRDDTTSPFSRYLYALAEPLGRILKVNFTYLYDFVQWVDDLPLDTPGEQQVLLTVFDQAIAETSNPYDGQYVSPVNIAYLVAALANPQPDERVYDPCFGSGNFLVAAWQHVTSHYSTLRVPRALLEVTGSEINASAFLTGLTRMLLAGVEWPRVELGNSLKCESLDSEEFDVVIANPPIGAKPRRELSQYQYFPIVTRDSTGLFIQQALSQLKQHGRAVIAVPDGFLFRGGVDRELRRHLLEQGQLVAVIGMPAGAFAPYTSVKSSLLVLIKRGGVNRVRMIDASTLFEPRLGRKAPVIRMEVADKLASMFFASSFQRPTTQSEESGAEKILIDRVSWELNIKELEAADWDLSPRRREKGGLDDLLANLKKALGESGIIVSLADVAQVSAGRSIKSSDLLDYPPTESAVGYVRIKDLNQGKIGRSSSWLSSGLANLEHRSFLLPGDVLVSKSGTIGKIALVRNSAAGAIASRGLYVLRPDRQRLDAGYLLAYLASAACQNWLAAQSRGAVIQHLNRAVLDGLPVPLPPLQMQARAAAQYREFGTDVFAFLSQLTGNDESDRLSVWLAELNAKVPTFSGGLDDTPALSHFDSIIALIHKAENWVSHELVGSQAARWLTPLNEALLPLEGIAQIPPGAGLLSVLQNAERGIQATLDRTVGHLPSESQARAISERLLVWLRAVIADLIDSDGLQVRASPRELPAGSFAEFSVELENSGALPLRNILVKTDPNWGQVKRPYLAEGGVFIINLQGDTSAQGDNLTLRLVWRARVLSGEEVGGTVELVIRVIEPTRIADTISTELGGSPYVTGSPLEPKHGQSVFYGRDELLGMVSRQIATHGNVVLLEGNRRTGKTSILKHLEGREAIPGWLAVYASLQGAEGAVHVVGVPTCEVFREIARSIASSVKKLEVDVPLPGGQVLLASKPPLGIARACREGIGSESPFTDFREFLEAVLAVLNPRGLGLVLMLDEFDKLQEGIDNGVTSPQVPENIRFLIQTYPKFSAILTGSRRLKRLREEYWSALYGLGTNIPVTALDPESARKVVTEPVRGQLVFSLEAVERVIEITARHPYLLQCLCNRIFDYAVQTKNRSITVSVVNNAAHELVRDNEHFASLWDYAGLGPIGGRYRRQLILCLCALSFKQGAHVSFGTLGEQLAQGGVDVENEALDADLAYLRELELVEFIGELGDGEYRLAIPLMADWIEQQQDADVVASRARTEVEDNDA